MSNTSYPGISTLKLKLDSLLGKDAWFEFEPETIILELGLHNSANELLDKIYLLKTIGLRPEIFYEDFWFTLIATDVINGNVADFNSVPHVTSLELAYAILEMQTTLLTMGITPKYTDEFIEAVSIILKEEGYSKPISPFTFVPEEFLVKGQTEEDSLNKEKAIQLYIRHMTLND